MATDYEDFTPKEPPRNPSQATRLGQEAEGAHSPLPALW